MTQPRNVFDILGQIFGCSRQDIFRFIESARRGLQLAELQWRRERFVTVLRRRSELQ